MRWRRDVHYGVIPFRSKITHGCIPDRESRKKTRIYFAFSSSLVSLLFVSLFRSVPGVFPYLIYSFFPTPNSATFFFFVFLCPRLFSHLSIGFSLMSFFAESVTRCFMLIRWLHLDARLLSHFHFENWVGVQVLEHQSVM